MSFESVAQTLYIDGFIFKGDCAVEIAEEFKMLPVEERVQRLSLFLEIGWAASQIGYARLSSDYFEKITQAWATKLSFDFKESGLAVFDNLKESIAQELGDLRIALLVDKAKEEKASEIKDRTTLKGITFEAEVLETLGTMASFRADTVSFVGNSPGSDGSKKGDFIYELRGSDLGIAIEAKDLTSRVSMSRVEDLISGSVKNRGCQFGIFVVRDQACLPEGFGAFYVNDRFIACDLSHLDVAIKMSAIMIESNQRKKTNASGFDVFITEIKEEMATVDEVIKASNSSKKSAHKSEELARGLKERLELKIETFLSHKRI